MKKIFDTEVTDERIINLAAGGCFQPNNKDATVHAMQCVIEMLVLPDPRKAYSLEDITGALRLSFLTPVAPDAKTCNCKVNWTNESVYNTNCCGCGKPRG